jgi:voltage-gated potassium channel
MDQWMDQCDAGSRAAGEGNRLAHVEPSDMDERSLRWEQRFEWPMVIAALLVIPLLVIEESDFGEPWDTVGVILNWGTWLAFAAEAVVMVAVTPRPVEWIKRHPIDFAVVFLTPPFLPGNLAVFRLLRLLRLGRLFSLRDLLSLEGIRYAAFLAGFLVLVGGAAYAAVEEDQNLSAWDGIWWAATTVTTVGYGDSIPKTDEGRMIAVVVMLVGIGFVALLTAFIANRWVQQDVGEEQAERDDQVLAELRAIRDRLTALEKRIDGG